MALSRRIFLDRTDRVQRLSVPSQELTRIAERLRRRGVQVIDLSNLSAQDSATGPSGLNPEMTGWLPTTCAQMGELREAAAHWYDVRFSVSLDPDTEIGFAPNAVIALTLLSMAFVEAGDMVLLPDPGAPFYRGAVVFCGGGVVPYHLSQSNGYRPRFAALAERLVGRTRMLVLAYPHNPTTATADENFYAEAVAFARRNQTFVVADGAFGFAFDGKRNTPSFLSATLASAVGVEMAALDTNFGIPGLSVAAVCGNREAVSALNFLIDACKWKLPVGMVQTATSLLLNGEDLLRGRSQRLAESRRLLTATASDIGWTPSGSDLTPFLWIAVPARVGSEAFCRRMLRRAGILLSPGTVFGESGEGFVRMAIPEDSNLTKIVCERLQRHAKVYQPRLPRKRVSLRERLRSKPMEG